MATRVTEGELAGLRWLGVQGERHAALRALGDAARDDVAAVVERVVDGGVARRAAEAPELVDRVRRATRSRHPTQVAEVVAIGEGADADLEAIMLANLRGDLGRPDGDGCSDVGWQRRRSYLAHNEDGDQATNLTIVSLAIDGEPPIAVEWYPGFLPSNSFLVTGNGLTWGIDHLGVDQPYRGPGRHFVARALQGCESFDEAVTFLSGHPSAGGFAYTIGEVDSGRVATVEVAAGESATVYADPEDRPLLWHTNHVRYLDPEYTWASQDSVDRGHVLDALEPPELEPDVSWFLDLLGGAAVPKGVRQPSGEGSATLCTAVADLGSAEVTFQSAGGSAETLGIDALLAGP